jgi:macrolide-specific efflux system membrane fusion protein
MAADGSKNLRDVQVGVTNRIQAEILAGLSEGDKVVTGIRSAGGQRTSQEGRRLPRMMR